jgi:hypothetical protein
VEREIANDCTEIKLKKYTNKNVLGLSKYGTKNNRVTYSIFMGESVRK